jgi:hypothetical protein
MSGSETQALAEPLQITQPNYGILQLRNKISLGTHLQMGPVRAYSRCFHQEPTMQIATNHLFSSLAALTISAMLFVTVLA